MSPRLAVRPRSSGAVCLRAPAFPVDVAEVARFVAERDADVAHERWLIIGQLVMLLLVLGVIGALVAIQRG